MRELDKTKCYTLEHLNDDELKTLSDWFIKNENEHQDVFCVMSWFKQMIYEKKHFSYYSHKECGYLWGFAEKVDNPVDAKELFYTLENIQVDCRELSEEQIKEMAMVFELGGYKKCKIENFEFKKTADDYVYLRKYNIFNEIALLRDKFETITYDKFMELFAPTKEYTSKLTTTSNESVKAVEALQEGLKEKENKLAYELDFDFITAMTQRIEQEPKYPPYNWQKPMNVQDLADALFRHAIEIKKGNFNDNGDLGHLMAVANNAMFIYYQLKNNEHTK